MASAKLSGTVGGSMGGGGVSTEGGSGGAGSAGGGECGWAEPHDEQEDLDAARDGVGVSGEEVLVSDAARSGEPVPHPPPSPGPRRGFPSPAGSKAANSDPGAHRLNDELPEDNKQLGRAPSWLAE
mmetsp:Transcript_122688/g.381969  ORF Transcript_122688/g.381969 Transcript_122688/m.381969 type:complete len:126 (-) Transcript_122688:144-521(-)